MEVENFKRQHFENYKRAIEENIKKNTSTLVDEDIMSLLKKPPLETMDLIKSKFLAVAKKNKKVLNTENLDKILEQYRKDIIVCLSKIKKTREEVLLKKVEDFQYTNEVEIFKITKKDFVEINKQNKNLLKETIKSSLDTEILKKIDLILDEADEDLKKKMKLEISKYLKGSYQKQLLENIEFKTIVKDTTLINGVKEQADHYLFTLSNSRLLKEDLEK